jgi:hypothetical protein
MSAGMLEAGSPVPTAGGAKRARGSSAATRRRPSWVFSVARRPGVSSGMVGKARQWTRIRSPYSCSTAESRTAAL